MMISKQIFALFHYLLHTELNGTKILVLSERLSGLWLLSLNWLRFRIMREKVPGVVLQNFATAARLFFSGLFTERIALCIEADSSTLL